MREVINESEGDNKGQSGVLLLPINKGDIMKIRYINEVLYCCDMMKTAMKDYRTIIYNEDNIRFSISLRNGDYWIETIKFCPFCGEEIKITNE